MKLGDLRLAASQAAELIARQSVDRPIGQRFGSQAFVEANRRFIPVEHRHAWAYNLVLLLIFACVLMIGLTSADKSVSAFAGSKENHFTAIVIVTGLSVLLLGMKVFSSSKEESILTSH